MNGKKAKLLRKLSGVGEDEKIKYSQLSHTIRHKVHTNIGLTVWGTEVEYPDEVVETATVVLSQCNRKYYKELKKTTG